MTAAITLAKHAHPNATPLNETIKTEQTGVENYMQQFIFPQLRQLCSTIWPQCPLPLLNIVISYLPSQCDDLLSIDDLQRVIDSPVLTRYQRMTHELRVEIANALSEYGRIRQHLFHNDCNDGQNKNTVRTLSNSVKQVWQVYQCIVYSISCWYQSLVSDTKINLWVEMEHRLLDHCQATSHQLKHLSESEIRQLLVRVGFSKPDHIKKLVSAWQSRYKL